MLGPLPQLRSRLAEPLPLNAVAVVRIHPEQSCLALSQRSAPGAYLSQRPAQTAPAVRFSPFGDVLLTFSALSAYMGRVIRLSVAARLETILVSLSVGSQPVAIAGGYLWKRQRASW